MKVCPYCWQAHERKRSVFCKEEHAKAGARHNSARSLLSGQRSVEAAARKAKRRRDRNSQTL